MMNSMKDKMGRAMPMRGNMGDKMGRAMAKPMGMKKGGKAESKAMVKKEISFMKKKGAPKSLIKHEEKEAKGYKSGGMTSSYRKAADGIASKGKTKGKQVKMRYGGAC